MINHYKLFNFFNFDAGNCWAPDWGLDDITAFTSFVAGMRLVPLLFLRRTGDSSIISAICWGETGSTTSAGDSTGLGVLR